LVDHVKVDESNLQRQVLFTVDDVGKLKIHNCHRTKKLYRSDRSEIIWTPEQIDQLCRVAPEWVARIAISASETGLRVGDLTRSVGSMLRVARSRSARRSGAGWPASRSRQQCSAYWTPRRAIG
ncbi:MAG: hypothetical protein AAFU49_22590, partial [Pseudomonadota bacterium]